MSHSFELAKQSEFEATPAQVWDAIATGPGIDAWFMGHSEVEPVEGGAVTFSLGDISTVGTVTTWDLHKRFAYRSGEPDDSFMAFEYLIEGRDGGSTVLRMVQSGVLDDDWEAEYDALDKGWNLYLHTISEYLEHFGGRTPHTINVLGARAADEVSAWAVLTYGLGLDGTPAEGDPIHLPVADVDGVIDYVDAPTAIGVRTSDGLYRFAGRYGSMGIGHHVFAEDLNQAAAERAWRSWLDDLYS
ncbi:MAG TPA: SRPBCC domain-containing protein [Pseudonocardiaceae bacterium]|jgi:uncharacterized protein YndB with AHSA1/START domain|nr:SRPBCC domain-containing protein [Pseudonocardiaceae bacterium]